MRRVTTLAVRASTSRAHLAAHGDQPVAVLPVGGSIGRALVVQLADQGVDVEAVNIKGATRANITIVEPDGVTTKLNEPGPLLSAEEIDSVIDAVSRRAASGGWVVVGGSLPPGVEPGVVSMVIAAAHAAGALVAFDTAGDALTAGVAAEPELAKPNVDELLEVVGGSAETLGDVVAACTRLADLGAKSVLCSLGPDGALLVKGDDVWHASAPSAEVRNTVGAGDCTAGRATSSPLARLQRQRYARPLPGQLPLSAPPGPESHFRSSSTSPVCE